MLNASVKNYYRPSITDNIRIFYLRVRQIENMQLNYQSFYEIEEMEMATDFGYFGLGNKDLYKCSIRSQPSERAEKRKKKIFETVRNVTCFLLLAA